MTMISGLAGPYGEPSQSPYQVTGVRPAATRNTATWAWSMNRSVSGTTRASRSPAKRNHVSYVTSSPATALMS